MPYSTKSGGFERARRLGHVPIVENELVHQKLTETFHIAEPPSARDGVSSDLLIAIDDLGATGEPLRWAVSVDGSPHEVAVREQFPSTRVGFIQVAGVLVDLAAMLGEADAHLVDPAVIHEAIEEKLYSVVMPGSNVCRQDTPTVRDSWRAEIYETFRDRVVEGRPLLDIFRVLVDHSEHALPNGVQLSRCTASDSCSARDIPLSMQPGNCPSCGGQLYPTDALRIHEEVLEEHSNATALGRLMTVLEHITMIGILRFLFERQPRVLGSVAFVIDGPLAVFGPQAWVARAIRAYFDDFRAQLDRQHLRHPVIVGVEKTGQFAEHASAIADMIPRRTVMSLPDRYIYEHILTFHASPGVYGQDTYYGRKFFYKTGQGHLLTITVPKLQLGEDEHNPVRYPALPDTAATLDRIGTSLYEDALIPVALAHSFASIPLRTGSRVLTLLSQSLLQPSPE